MASRRFYSIMVKDSHADGFFVVFDKDTKEAQWFDAATPVIIREKLNPANPKWTAWIERGMTNNLLRLELGEYVQYLMGEPVYDWLYDAHFKRNTDEYLVAAQYIKL